MTKKTAEEKKSNVEFDFRSIKSFDDACKKVNVDPSALPEVSMIPESMRKAIIAVYKLFIIFQAINNGWHPDWNNSDQYKYFPWLWIKATKSLSSGFGFDVSSYFSTGTITIVGSRLCTDTSEKAIYIGETFQDEYKDFFLISQ